MRTVKITEKLSVATRAPGLINGGVYWMRRAAIEALPPGPCSLERDVLPACRRLGKRWRAASAFPEANHCATPPSSGIRTLTAHGTPARTPTQRGQSRLIFMVLPRVLKSRKIEDDTHEGDVADRPWRGMARRHRAMSPTVCMLSIQEVRHD